MDGVRELLGSSADYILESPTPTVGKATAKAKPTVKAQSAQRTPSGVNSAAIDMAREQQDAGEPTPPSDLPAGTTLYKTLPNGNPVWLLPDGKKREQHL